MNITNKTTPRLIDRSASQVMEHEMNCMEAKAFEHHRANPMTYYTSEEEEHKYET